MANLKDEVLKLRQNIDAVYEAGKAAGGGGDNYYDMFWDSYQQNGNRTNYYQLFVQGGWNDITFNPKYPIECSGVKEYETTNASQIFYASRITEVRVPIIVTGLPMSQTFFNCIKLKTIANLTLNGVTKFYQCFSYCSVLENITINGSIDVSFDISTSAVLTSDSVQSIIDHLKDLTGQTAQKLTLHSTVTNNLTEAQLETIWAKNWTV